MTEKQRVYAQCASVTNGCIYGILTNAGLGLGGKMSEFAFDS